MIVKTKKYRLSPSHYVRIALWNLFRGQWWISLISMAFSGAIFYVGYPIASMLPMLLLLLYVLFWWIQLYGVTKMEDNRLMFERLFYELSKDRVVIFLSTKQGMPIEWKQITSAREGKDYFILFISKVQFIYLPFSIFQGEQPLHLTRMLLKNKKLIG